MKWKNKFNRTILRRGEDYADYGRVDIVSKANGLYFAEVRGSKIYNVLVQVADDEIKTMSCTCPFAKSGENCKHMAAVLYEIEEAYEEIPTYVEEIIDIPQGTYSYFDVGKITQPLKITKEVYEKAKSLNEKNKVTLDKIEIGYINTNMNQSLRAMGRVNDRGVWRDVEVAIAKERLIESDCGCPECYSRRRGYYWYYDTEPICEHLTALLTKTIQYAIKNNIGDDTDYQGNSIIKQFNATLETNKLELSAESDIKNTIVPRLEKKDGDFKVSFKVGQNKKLIIKNLSDFVAHMEAGSVFQYGKTVEVLHRKECFDESVKYIDFINKYVIEEEAFEERMANKYKYTYYGKKVGTTIFLYGSRLDEFYELMGDDEIEYHDKDNSNAKKQMIRKNSVPPAMVMDISVNNDSKTGEFQGISVHCNIPALLQGQNNTYFIEDRNFNKLDSKYARTLKPLMSGENYDGTINFRIGRNNLSGFYYSVLPKLRNIMEVKEEEPEIIHQYLRPEAQFIFYLDSEDDDVTCKAEVNYGDEKFLLLDGGKEFFREKGKEAQVYGMLQNWFPVVDTESSILHCNYDEELIYDLLENGINQLLEIGEVQASDNFRKLNVRQKTRVSVGVSLSNGLLDLEITSDDISQDELLEILDSYRRKKKFHRLRNGDFLTMEDGSLESIDELIKGLGVTDKEIEAGMLKVPMYRALYLDKLLEENESIYANRDGHFRRMVRDFKAISESDFEEPITLSKILRNYQKKGFKWLKTIEAYGFGGILADDMGLGKTLQMISVLLSAKESNFDKKTSALVVCPASLVYNWGEELSHYAPELKVLMVVGSQSERKKLIKDCYNYDVVVTSYDLLKRDISQYKDKDFAYEIIDEAQYIKNHTTAASKAVKVINGKIRFALTGTPIENRLSELWSIFDYLMPGFLYGYDGFKKNFETPIAKDGNVELTKRLQKMVSPFILRRLKQDVLKELPDKIEKVRFDRFEDTQQKLYDAQVVRMKQTIAGQDDSEYRKNKIQILAELTKLRQICCDPSLCFENYDGESAKRQGCLELVESAVEGGHKILLFSQFTSMLELIQSDLDKAGLSYYVITGATPKERRLQLVNSFNKDETNVFLISLKAGGTGLNLTGADVVIHYDPWWNLAVQNQATDRAHRIGQTKVVTEYKLIAKNTIEEKIQELQNRKKDLANQIISGEGASLSAMSKDELLELLEV